MKAKQKVLKQLEDFGESVLKAELESKRYSNYSYKLLLLFFKDFEMLLTFVCGFVANLPISVLFNILTFNNVDFSNKPWVVYFVIYILCFVSTIVMTICAFDFTIRYVKVKAEKTIPARIRECIKSDGSLGYLKARSIWTIISGVFFTLCIIALFVVNAFFLG